jgi:hypothetical protein
MLIINFFPSSCHVLLLRSKHLPTSPYSQTPFVCVLPLMWGIKVNTQINSSYYLQISLRHCLPTLGHCHFHSPHFWSLTAKVLLNTNHQDQQPHIVNYHKFTHEHKTVHKKWTEHLEFTVSVTYKLTRTRFSVLSPFVSNLTTFLSNILTCFPSNDFTLSARKKNYIKNSCLLSYKSFLTFSIVMKFHTVYGILGQNELKIHVQQELFRTSNYFL